MQTKVKPSGRESHFGTDEIIVTKTDLKGRITYANDVFLRVSKYTSAEVVGQPHSMIRHPDMPRCIFKMLWDAIQSQQEIFAYVVNLASDGDHYWVLAHVTPSYDGQGNIVGYHSMRRKPDPAQIERIKPIYRRLLEEERQPSNRKDGMISSHDHLLSMLQAQGMSYDRFVLSL